ncbi:histone H1/H5 family protein, partial [Enterococcus faecium]
EQQPATDEPEKVTVEKKPKAPKEKKPKAAKEKKPKQSKTLTHPPYFEMITEALMGLQEKSGSSPYAIAKYMEEKHKDELPPNFRKILAVQLKHFAAKGNLIKIRASYKLSEAAGKKDKVPWTTTVKKTRSVTAAAKIKAEAAAAAAVTKKAKKSTPAKPKQPKSIKSPAVKKAKKATA